MRRLCMLILLSLLIAQVAIDPAVAAQWKQDSFVEIIFPIVVLLLVLIAAVQDPALAVTMVLGILFVLWLNI